MQRFGKNDLSGIIREIEKLRRSSREHIIIFKNNGRIKRFIGNHNQVSIDNDSLFHLKDALILHNHPGGASFSWEDVKIITQQEVKECFLVTERYVYTLKRPEHGWDVDVDSEMFENTYNACFQIAANALDKLVAQNEMSEYERDVEIIHYIWTVFFQIRDVEYSRKTIEEFTVAIQRFRSSDQ